MSNIYQYILRVDVLHIFCILFTSVVDLVLVPLPSELIARQLRLSCSVEFRYLLYSPVTATFTNIRKEKD